MKFTDVKLSTVSLTFWIAAMEKTTKQVMNAGSCKMGNLVPRAQKACNISNDVAIFHIYEVYRTVSSLLTFVRDSILFYFFSLNNLNFYFF